MPVFPAGRAPARMEYGIERMLAQATPTPTIDRSSRYLLLMNATESRPSAPASRHSAWVSLRPSRSATAGSANEKAKQTRGVHREAVAAPGDALLVGRGARASPPKMLRATATPK